MQTFGSRFACTYLLSSSCSARKAIATHLLRLHAASRRHTVSAVLCVVQFLQGPLGPRQARAVEQNLKIWHVLFGASTLAVPVPGLSQYKNFEGAHGRRRENKESEREGKVVIFRRIHNPPTSFSLSRSQNQTQASQLRGPPIGRRRIRTPDYSIQDLCLEILSHEATITSRAGEMHESSV